MKYYLQMEAVNLYSFIEDTQNLSVIRGGGLLLLNSVKEVLNEFKNINPVSTGASNGLFSFEAEDISEAQNVCSAVRKFLINHYQLGYTTFVVNIQKVTDEDDFIKNKESVLAQNRWQQWQQPTLILPEKNSDIKTPVCSLDNVRPGVEKEDLKAKKNLPISLSAKTRFLFGREQKLGKKRKENFYTSEIEKYFPEDHTTERSAAFTFVEDLDHLTDDPEKGNLHHKMAVIYLDGNRFGSIQIDKCKNEDTQKEFDTFVKKNRAEILKKLLEKIDAEFDFRYKKQFRLETLLWGGDELIWVVPAWKGWEVLSLFYQESQQWPKFYEEKLTHAGGLVFCHHNAPIHRITKLAKYLAEEAKKENNRQDLFQYVVLESFDHIGQDLWRFRKAQYKGNRSLSLDGQQMNNLIEKFERLKLEFPRSRLFSGIYAAVSEANRCDFSEEINRIEPTPCSICKDRMNREKIDEIFNKQLLEELSKVEIEQREKDFVPILGHNPGLWLHLAELWDYIPEG